MEEMQLFTCYAPFVSKYYLLMILTSLLFLLYFILKTFIWNEYGDYDFSDYVIATIFFILCIVFLFLFASFFMMFFDGFYSKILSFFVHILRYFSDSSGLIFCIDSQSQDYSSNLYREIDIYKFRDDTRFLITFLLAFFLGFLRLIYDCVRYAYFIPEAIRKFFKNISLRIAIAKEERKLKALRSEEEGKLNAVKLQLKSVLETEKKTVENTLLQLTAQQQRVAASRQQLMVKDMDQEI